MITPVGVNAEMTAAAVRAGVSGYRETDLYSKKFDPLTIASVPDDALPPLSEKLKQEAGLTSRQRRLLRLITPALGEAIGSCAMKGPVPLFLAGPETLPERPTPLGSRFIESLVSQTGANIDPQYCRLFSAGRAAGFQAVDMAFRYFESTESTFALVGGADSFIDLHWLRTMDNAGRVKTDGAMDSFVAGEAAGFLLLATEKGVAASGQRNPVRVYPPGLASEPGHRYSKQPYRGDGLSSAFQLAVANGPGQPIKTVYASLNGENFGAKELSVASIRNRSAFRDDMTTEHPADCFGDIGAAFGPVMLGLAVLGIQKGYSQGPALVYCSSEQQPRAAICLSA
jgi:3-oxoacyl-[acyl-carrier-protein] synthase-1